VTSGLTRRSLSEGGDLPSPIPGARVALVHDWLTGMRGGERVLEALCRLFPDAPIYTLVHVPGRVSEAIARHEIRTSILQRVPGVERWYRHLLPCYPAALRALRLAPADLVISSSHCVAKSAVAPRGARHLCYCHTPVRYAYDQFDAYFGPARVGRVTSAVMRPLMSAFARWDVRTSDRPDRYVANSQHVARRIARHYNRRSAVTYPPVDTVYYAPEPGEREARALIVSALVPYKRVDVAIAACQRAGVPLTVVGQGPEQERLRATAGRDVEFVGSLTDAEVRQQYRTASVVLLPGEEDFGIVPVEAQACGTPVVALGRGGATETVIDGETGVLTEDGIEAFAAGVRRALETRWNAEACRRQAERFSLDRFLVDMTHAVRDLMAAPPADVRW
jgi:glycosyltransferase involved in cell wall biosynthesis